MLGLLGASIDYLGVSFNRSEWRHLLRHIVALSSSTGHENFVEYTAKATEKAINCEPFVNNPSGGISRLFTQNPQSQICFSFLLNRNCWKLGEPRMQAVWGYFHTGCLPKTIQRGNSLNTLEVFM